MNFRGYTFPSIGVELGDKFINQNTGAVYRYLGGDPRVATNWVLDGGLLSSQPDTSGWGSAQIGAHWSLSSDGSAYRWDGTQIVFV